MCSQKSFKEMTDAELASIAGDALRFTSSVAYRNAMNAQDEINRRINS